MLISLKGRHLLDFRGCFSRPRAMGEGAQLRWLHVVLLVVRGLHSGGDAVAIDE